MNTKPQIILLTNYKPSLNVFFNKTQFISSFN